MNHQHHTIYNASNYSSYMSAQNRYNFVTGKGFDIFSKLFCNNSIYIMQVYGRCSVGMARAWRRGRTTPISKCLNYYKKTDKYFFIIPFASSMPWSKLLLKILSSMPDYPKGRATPIFYLEKYYKRTDEYFSMIPLALSWLWSKISLKILSSMGSHLKERGRTTPNGRFPDMILMRNMAVAHISLKSQSRKTVKYFLHRLFLHPK